MTRNGKKPYPWWQHKEAREKENAFIEALFSEDDLDQAARAAGYLDKKGMAIAQRDRVLKRVLYERAMRVLNNAMKPLDQADVSDVSKETLKMAVAAALKVHETCKPDAKLLPKAPVVGETRSDLTEKYGLTAENDEKTAH